MRRMFSKGQIEAMVQRAAEPDKYIKDAAYEARVLTLTKKDNTTVEVDIPYEPTTYYKHTIHIDNGATVTGSFYFITSDNAEFDYTKLVQYANAYGCGENYNCVSACGSIAEVESSGEMIVTGFAADDADLYIMTNLGFKEADGTVEITDTVEEI